MKKTLSFILALTLVMSLSIPAFANETDVSVGSYGTDVNGTYVEGTTASGTVFSVDIAWNGMDFIYYAEKAPVWDATNHTYSKAEGARWEGEGTITVTNHSNAKIQAQPVYTAESGYESATMIFEDEQLNIASAEVGSAQIGTIKVTPSGSLPASASGGKIGTITVTIAEDTTKTPLEEAQELRADIQTTFDQVQAGAEVNVSNRLEAQLSAMDSLVQDAKTFEESGSWVGTNSGSYDGWSQMMKNVRQDYEDLLSELDMA